MKKKFIDMLNLMFMVMLACMGILSTALTADKDVDRKEAGLQSFPVSSGETIYKGALVCVDTDGYLIPAADTAGLKFVGVAYEKVVNSGGDGAKWCRVYTEGSHELACTGITQLMVGQSMYVADSGSVDDTSFNAIHVGTLVEFVDATKGWVDIGQRGKSLANHIKFQRTTGGPIKEVTNSGDIAWTDLDLDTILTIPEDSIGVIFETYVYGSAGLPALLLRKKGETISDWQWMHNATQVQSVAHIAVMIVEMDADKIIQYKLTSTGGSGAAFYLKLIGWIMKP